VFVGDVRLGVWGVVRVVCVCVGVEGVVLCRCVCDVLSFLQTYSRPSRPEMRVVARQHCGRVSCLEVRPYVLNRYSGIPGMQPHEYEYRISPGKDSQPVRDTRRGEAALRAHQLFRDTPFTRGLANNHLACYLPPLYL